MGDVGGAPGRESRTTDAGGERCRTWRSGAASRRRPAYEDQEKLMAEQPSIADHAIIGDLQTAALVASNGDV
ncbi:MAG: hypothetical protein ACRDI2_21265, partial [Chloroflexota bacterium]